MTATSAAGPAAAPLSSRPGLRLAQRPYEAMVGHAYDGFPLEACGLLGRRPGDRERRASSTRARNAAASAKVYTVDPRTTSGPTETPSGTASSSSGVMHSHTHTEAYPTPTDVAQAPDPDAGTTSS